MATTNKCLKCGSRVLGNEEVKECNNCIPELVSLISDCAKNPVKEDEEAYYMRLSNE